MSHDQFYFNWVLLIAADKLFLMTELVQVAVLSVEKDYEANVNMASALVS